MVLDACLQIGEIEGYPLAVHRDGHLDVPHQVAGLLLDPSPDLHHHRIQPCLGIRVEPVDVSRESGADAACLFR